MRFRSTNAKSAEDRAIAARLEKAARELEEALRLANAAKWAGYRSKRVGRDLGRALQAIENVGSLASPYGDPEPELRARRGADGRSAAPVPTSAPIYDDSEDGDE